PRGMAAPAPLWLLFPLSYALLLRERLPSWADIGFLLAAATVLGLTTLVLVRDWRRSLTRSALAVGGSLYLAFTLSFYLSLYFLHQPDPNHLGFGYVIAIFGAIWVGDTAAMVAGLRFGRHHFFARISPKKTVEGAVAELLASTVFFAIVGLLVNISFPHNLIIGLLIGIFAQVGDLVESQIKRTAGVKDASHLIPGHGGILDRVDSLLLVGVVVYYYVTSLHLACAAARRGLSPRRSATRTWTWSWWPPLVPPRWRPPCRPSTRARTSPWPPRKSWSWLGSWFVNGCGATDRRSFRSTVSTARSGNACG